MTRLRILAGQVEVPATRTRRDRDIHLERCAAKIGQRLESESVDLVVLPELSSIDYSREAFENLATLAEPLDGTSFGVYREIAVCFDVTIVYGIARLTDDGYAISQVALGPDGLLLSYYDKLHIAQFGASVEKDYFSAGKHLSMFDLKDFRIAPIICYDIRIPELSRTLCLEYGVNLILHCGAYYRDESFPSWHAFVTTRAMENQCFVLSLNRAGTEYGSSVLCPPWLSDEQPMQHFDPADEDFRTVEIDCVKIREARQQYPFLRDKREDYRELECLSLKRH